MSDNLPQRWHESPELNPGAPFAGEPGERESESILRVVLDFAALLRRNLLLVLAVFGVAGAALARSISQEEPVYRANGVLRLTDKARAMSGGLTSTANDPLTRTTDPILSRVQVLQSRAVAGEVARRQGLRLRSLERTFGWRYLDSVVVDSTAPNDTIHVRFAPSYLALTSRGTHVRAAYGEPITVGGVHFIVRTHPPVERADLVVVPLSIATDEVARTLRGRARDRTDIVDVTFEANDPVRAQLTVNAALKVFYDLSADRAREQSVRRREFIQQQLHKAEAKLTEAEYQRNAFQMRERVFSSSDKFRGQQSDLTALEVRRQELEADRRMLGTFLAALDSAPAGGVSTTSRDERLNTVMSSPVMAGNQIVVTRFGELTRLRQARDSMTTGPFAAAATNPDVRRLDALIASAQASVLSAVRAQVVVTDARLEALDDLKTRLTAQMADAPTAASRELSLLANVDTYKHEADRLREELQKAQIDEAAQDGDVEVVDAAVVPRTANASDRPTRIVFTALLAFALASGLAFARENRRDVIRRREELSAVSPLPNLAMVPQFRRLPGTHWWQLSPGAFTPFRRSRRAQARGPVKTIVTAVDTHSPGAEAYRTLRTNLLFSAAVHSLHRVVVTSAAPKEGKSTTAANLAVACAHQGQKVLLMDCDLRGPSVHAMFGRPRSPGLTNVLIGSATLDDALTASGVPQLTVLAAGTTPPNPGELLGSPKFGQLLEDLSTRFDMIVIDTPPLLAASDAAILARVTDGTLMVVRAGQTERGAVQDAMQQLRTVGARILGTVLNDPDAQIAKFSPYYHQYYYNYYGPTSASRRG